MTMKKAKIAVLVSGGGTNLQALLDAQRDGKMPHGEIVLVVSSEKPVYSLLVTLEKVFEGDVVALQYQLHEHPVVGYDIVGYLHTRSSLRSSNSPSSRAKNGLSRSYRK